MKQIQFEWDEKKDEIKVYGGYDNERFI